MLWWMYADRAYSELGYESKLQASMCYYYLQSMNNDRFVSRPSLNEKHFINDLHDGLWILAQTLISPIGHVELCYPSHMFILLGKKVDFTFQERKTIC